MSQLPSEDVSYSAMILRALIGLSAGMALGFGYHLLMKAVGST